MKRHSNSDIAPINRKYTTRIPETITNILQCTVCLELPKWDEFYQCSWSHLLCATCALRLLSDASKHNKTAKCPSCRHPITYEKMTKRKNYVVMKIMFELPKKCSKCDEECKLGTVDNHMKNECPERIVNCSYRRIGCNWSGTYRQFKEHKVTCECPHKNVCDIIGDLRKLQKTQRKSNWVETFKFRNLKNADSIHFRDVKLRARFCMYTNRLLLESFPFNAFEESWTIRVRSTKKSQCQLKYRMILNSKPRNKFLVGYYLLESTKENLEIKSELHSFRFSNKTMKSDYKEINFTDVNATNKVLAKKCTWVRIGIYK